MGSTLCPAVCSSIVNGRSYRAASSRRMSQISSSWLSRSMGRGTQVLVDCYANAPRRVERIAPADVQVRYRIWSAADSQAASPR